MSEDFLTSSVLTKRLMDFMGKKASPVDPKIPDTGAPDYTQHGSHALNRLVQGMSLEEALYALDVPWNLVTKKVTSAGYASTFISITRTQPLLIMARVDRVLARDVDVTLFYNFSKNISVNQYHKGAFNVSIWPYGNVVMWTTDVTEFGLYYGASPIDTVQIMHPDGSATLMGVVTPSNGLKNFSVAYISGELGVVTNSELIAIGTHEF